MFVNSYIDYNLVSRFSGSGLSSTNNRLESLPSSGVNSPAYFLSASGDNTFWHNDASDTSYPPTESHFLLSFDKPSVPPTGDIRVHIVNNLFDMYNDTYFNKLTLWYLKENNPHLTQDYLIASGNVDLHAAPPGLDWNTINVALITEPLNNYSPGINGYMSLSGAWLFAGPDPSGSVLIDSMYLRFDGNAVPYENNFNCNLINSTLYTKTYTPNVNSNNHFTGSGFVNMNGVQLEYLSGEQLTEPIKNGAVNSWLDSYWTTDGENYCDYIDFDPLSIEGKFDIAFNKLDIIPTGTLNINIKFFGAVGTDMYTWGDGIQLWAKRNNNPALSGDILIGRLLDDYLFPSPVNEVITFTESVTINEGGRSSWLPLITSGEGLVINASGSILRFDAMPSSGTWKFYGMEMMASGTPTDGTGGLPYNQTVNLHTIGSTTYSGVLNMITTNIVRDSGILPMSITGNIPYSGNFNLIIENKVAFSGSMEMTTFNANTLTKSLMMTLKSHPFGSGLQGTEMTIVGPSQLPYSGIIPMVVYQNTSPNTSMDMFIQNNNITSSGRFNMFIQAPSGTYGSVPWSGILPMYIARDSEGVDAGLNMYIGAPNTQESGFNMFIEGTNLLTSQFDISISGGGPMNSSLNCFLHGF
jgi:hypothetical protein